MLAKHKTNRSLDEILVYALRWKAMMTTMTMLMLRKKIFKEKKNGSAYARRIRDF
jgi:hypothetical protein